MTWLSKPSFLLIAACVGTGVIGTGAVYHYETMSISTNFGSSNQVPAETVPTPEYLIAHPNALKLAQQQCLDSRGPNVVAVCDNAHSAASSLLANEYRNAASGKAQ